MLERYSIRATSIFSFEGCAPAQPGGRAGGGSVARLAALLPLLAALSVCPGPLANTGPAQLTLTEDDAVRLALRNNRGLISARLRREVQRFALKVNEDRYRPRANVDTSIRDSRNGRTEAELFAGPTLRVPTGGEFSLAWSQPLHGGDGRGGMGTLAFSQPLLRGFGTAIDTAPVRLARLDEQRNILFLRDTVADVIVATATAYRSLIRADQAVAIDRESLARARRQLEINRSLIRAGRMADREIVQTEAEVANRELALAESENGLSRANARLLSVLDLDRAAGVSPVQQLPAVEPVQHVLEQGLLTAFENRNDYRRARIDEAAAELNLRIAENNRLWDLNLHASVSKAGDGERDYDAGLGLSIPLGDRAPKLAAVRAGNELQEVRIALAELRQSIRIAVNQAMLDVETGYRRVELARRARELAEQTVDVEQEKLSLGLSSTFQLTAVEDALVEAKTRELDAVIGYLNTVTHLDWTLGTTLATWGVDIADFEPVGAD